MILLIFISLISMIIMKIAMLISMKKMIDLSKNSSFECGFDPVTSPRISFSLQFYMVMIIFLIFDVELVLLIPMIKTLYISNIFQWVMTSTMLILILLLGIYYEWAQGILNWTL